MSIAPCKALTSFGQASNSYSPFSINIEDIQKTLVLYWTVYRMVTQTEINTLGSQPLLKNLAISHILSLFAIEIGNKTNRPFQDTIYVLNITHLGKLFWDALRRSILDFV